MNDKAKIVIAVVCLGVAGLAVAYQMGAFSGGAKGAKTTQNANDDDVLTNEDGMTYRESDDGTTSVNIGDGRVPMD